MKLVPGMYGGRTLHLSVEADTVKAQKLEAALRAAAAELGVPVSESHCDIAVIVPTDDAYWSGSGRGYGSCLHAGVACNFQIWPGQLTLDDALKELARPTATASPTHP